MAWEEAEEPDIEDTIAYTAEDLVRPPQILNPES